MLTNYQLGLVAFTWGQFHMKCSKYLSLLSWNITDWIIQPYLPGANQLMCKTHFLSWVDFTKSIPSQPEYFIYIAWGSGRVRIFIAMMMSSNGNIFRVTGPLWGESTGDPWIPLTKASDMELWCFLWSEPEQRFSKCLRCQWFEMSLCSLWRPVMIKYGAQSG